MITVIGSINMDLVIKTPRIPQIGETLIGRDFMISPGGKGANQAIAAARLGHPTAMIGFVGEDAFGETLINGLGADGIDVTEIKRTSESSTGVACITVNESGNNYIIIDPGANFNLKPELIDERVIARSDVVLAQLEIPLETVSYSLKKAKELGKMTILNPAPARDFDFGILEYVDIITPNETECELLTGIRIEGLEDAQKAADYFFSLKTRDVVITMGEKGVYYSENGKMHHHKGFKVDALDTTAAGDSFNAALAVGMAKGIRLSESMDFCCSVGALTVSKSGAQKSLPTLQEVNDFLEKNTVKSNYKRRHIWKIK